MLNIQESTTMTSVASQVGNLPKGFPARFGVIETVYHQSGTGSGEPVVAMSRFGGPLTTDEQPFVRRFRVGPEWEPLPMGWLKEASQLILVHELDPPTTIPTAEERREAGARAIEVGIALPGNVAQFAAIRPGQTCRFQPVFLELLQVRSRSGECRAVLTLIPV